MKKRYWKRVLIIVKVFLYNHPCFSFPFHQGYSQSKRNPWKYGVHGFADVIQRQSSNVLTVFLIILWYRKITWWFFMKTEIVLWALGNYFMVTSGFISNRNRWCYVRTWYNILSRLQDVESNTWVNKFPLLAIYVVLKMRNGLQSFSWELWTPPRFNSAVISLFSSTWT